MNMGAAAWAFKHTANQNFVSVKNGITDRTYTVPLSGKTKRTAPDMHKAVFAAVQRGKSRRAYKLSLIKFCRTHRAGLGFAGSAFGAGFGAAAAAAEAGIKCSKSPACKTGIDKKSITEPEQNNGNYDKN